MKVEILHIDECPNWQEAGQRVQIALDHIGLADTGIEYRLLRSSEEAAGEERFAGSPTIVIDGADAFPASHITDLACRVYQTDHGFAGLPTVEQLVSVLRERVEPAR